MWMPIYSYSRLAAFAQCPLKYKYAYIDGIERGRRSIEAFMGNRFHEAMERLYEHAPQSYPSADELRELFLKLWDKEFADDVFSNLANRKPEDVRALGLRAIDDYWRRYQPFDQGRVLGLERELLVDLDGSGKYRLRCIIDRLMARDDCSFEIHDYKTGGFLPEQKKLDDDEQLALYEIAVRENWPSVKTVDLVWHYVAFDMEMKSRRTEEELDELKKRTCARIDEVEAARDFLPHETELCEWCDFLKICPLFAHRFAIENLPLEKYATDDAIGMVNRFAALDAEKRKLHEREKQIELEQERIKVQAVIKAEQEGVKRLFGDTHVLTIKDDIRVSYPKKGELVRAAFESAMHGLGLWERVIDVNFSSLKSMAHEIGWKGSGDIPLGLAEFLKIEPIKQVRISRRKDLDDD